MNNRNMVAEIARTAEVFEAAFVNLPGDNNRGSVGAEIFGVCFWQRIILGWM
jgi:hypothetical protein